MGKRTWSDVEDFFKLPIASCSNDKKDTKISPCGIIEFYNMCEQISPNDPLNALYPLQLKLVGPFDYLCGANINTPETYYRYFYDIPELTTIISAHPSSTFHPSDFHMTLYRDSPTESPFAIVTNSPSVGYIFEFFGDSLFSAILKLIKLLNKKNKQKNSKIEKLELSISDYIKNHNINIEKTSTFWKSRIKNITALDLTELGVKVDVDKKTDRGYRKLPCSNNELKKLTLNIKNDIKNANLLKELNEITNWVRIAVDECDFGTALHFGRNLMCCDNLSDNSKFMKVAKHQLTQAYKLLNRDHFAKIIELHLTKECRYSDPSTSFMNLNI